MAAAHGRSRVSAPTRRRLAGRSAGYRMAMRTLLVLLAAAMSALVLTASTAVASNPYTPTGVCGAGFGVIDHHRITGPKGGWLGTVYLLYNSRTGRNCSTLIKHRAVGKATFAEASIAAPGGRGGYKADNGEFRYYAGPVYVAARHRCVIYGARMRDARGNGGSWITPQPVHCR
jgi:hypothetical protein